MKNLIYNRKENVFEWNDTKLGIKSSGLLELMVIRKALDNRKVFNKIWRLQDGYGKPGYTPAQGFDWSAIRDSSDHATQSMYLVALEDGKAAALNRKLLSLKHN